MDTLSLATYQELAVKVNSLILQLNLDTLNKKTGRPLALTQSQILTLGIYWHSSGRSTKKSVYNDFRTHINCTYKTFVVNINKCITTIIYIAMKLLELHRSEEIETIKHIDGSVIPVCLLKNSKHHKTMKEYASYTKTKHGYEYGLKIHMVSDLKRKILNVKFTPASTDERSVVIDLIKDLGGLFIMDAGYVSKKLERDIFIEGKRIALIHPRANMKKLSTTIHHALYKTRYQIEFNFRDLKMFYGLVTSLPRSVSGYFCNYFFALVSYMIA